MWMDTHPSFPILHILVQPRRMNVLTTLSSVTKAPSCLPSSPPFAASGLTLRGFIPRHTLFPLSPNEGPLRSR